MTIRLNPYLNFKDNARDAMEFYRGVFGGELDLRTFKDLHAAQDPSEENLVMHSELKGDNAITLMASDTPKHMEFQPGRNFGMSLSGDDEGQLSGYFTKLSDGGTVSMPLQKAAWGDTFGMVTDRFGVNWLVNISPASG